MKSTTHWLSWNNVTEHHWNLCWVRKTKQAKPLPMIAKMLSVKDSAWMKGLLWKSNMMLLKSLKFISVEFAISTFGKTKLACVRKIGSTPGSCNESRPQIWRVFYVSTDESAWTKFSLRWFMFVIVMTPKPFWHSLSCRHIGHPLQSRASCSETAPRVLRNRVLQHWVKLMRRSSEKWYTCTYTNTLKAMYNRCPIDEAVKHALSTAYPRSVL